MAIFFITGLQEKFRLDSAKWIDPQQQLSDIGLQRYPPIRAYEAAERRSRAPEWLGSLTASRRSSDFISAFGTRFQRVRYELGRHLNFLKYSITSRRL